MDPVQRAAAGGAVRLGDLRVHRIGLGAMRVTGADVWGPPRDAERARDVLRRAVSLGVQLLDTADAYGPGASETLIGEALAPYPPDLVIATKGGLTRPGPRAWVRDASPAHLREAALASLRRLGLERIDVYQLHAVDPKVPFETSVRALAQLRDEGIVRHVGLCNVDLRQLDEASRIVPIVSVQNRYNLRERDSDDVVEACAARGIAFLPWFPLGTGKLLHDPVVVRVARKHAATPAQVALAWLLARSPTMLPIPGTSDPAHVEENVAAAALRLDDEDRAALR